MDTEDVMPDLNFNLIHANAHFMRYFYGKPKEYVADLVAARTYIDAEIKRRGVATNMASDLEGLARWEAQQ